jgi:hypothetical protein
VDTPNALLSALVIATLVGTIGATPSFAAAPSGAGWYHLSNDCTKAVYVINQELYISDADGGNEAQLTDFDDGIEAAFPRLSYDNSKIVFISNHQFYVVNSDGTGLLPLVSTESMATGSWPSWSPDGSKFVFLYLSQLYSVNADGTGLTNLTPSLPVIAQDGEGFSDWAPDGSKIVFDRYMLDEENVLVHDLALIDADGTDMAQLLDHGSFPRWSYDSSKVYFFSGGIENAIYSIEPDGTDETFVKEINESFPIESILCPDVSDLTPPSIDIASPANGAAMPSETFTVSGTASDSGSGLDKVEVSLDGGATWDDASGTSSWTFGAAGPLPGIVHIVARATDNAGNTATDSVQVTTPITVTIETESLDGQVLRMWTTVDPPNAGPQSGFAPNAVTAPAGNFIVAVQDYGSITFDHWSDGSTSRTRSISLSDDTTLTALYNMNSARGFTTLTYAGSEEQPDLTVQAQSIADGRSLRMWTYITAGPTTEEGTQYTVTVHNYLDRVFDHWEDGSTERIRTLTIEEAATITAYYNTG